MLSHGILQVEEVVLKNYKNVPIMTTLTLV
jgi:hypothetical protein